MCTSLLYRLTAVMRPVISISCEEDNLQAALIGRSSCMRSENRKYSTRKLRTNLFCSAESLRILHLQIVDATLGLARRDPLSSITERRTFPNKSSPQRLNNTNKDELHTLSRRLESSSNPMGQSKKKRYEITSEALQLHPFIWILILTSPSFENGRSDCFPPSRDTPINAREQVGTEKGGGIAPFT